MEIKETMRGDVAVLTLGKTDIGDAIEENLRHAIHRLLREQQVAKIVVDLAQVKWMTSSAFGILIAALNEAVQNGGNIHLARPENRVISAFSIMQLERLFKRFDTVEEAVAGFSDA